MRMTTPLRIAILGASGRMGRALIDATLSDPALLLAAAWTRAGSAASGIDAGVYVGRPPLGVVISTDLEAVLTAADVVVDFSQPAGTLAALPLCLAQQRPLVIGTTGFDAAQKQSIAAAAQRIPLCMAANFSVGVNLCLRLLALAAQALGPDYDVEISEAHHRHKVDAPSGTALRMGEAVAQARGQTLAEHAVYGREGYTGPRPAGAIGFATTRGGDVVGEHTVMFLGEGERVEITHKATNRGNFARGALRAARWLHGRAPGAYDMQEVLGL